MSSYPFIYYLNFGVNTSLTYQEVLLHPKKHISNIMELQDGDMQYIAEIHKAIQEVAKIKGVDKTGFRVITNYGEDGGQTILHLHYHVVGGKHLGPKIL